MWGQGISRGVFLSTCGIIPTRVGTSFRQGWYRIRHKDHPHACGDKLFCLSTACQVLGSSPRVWGQGIKSFHLRLRKWIIPTRVGTSAIAPDLLLTCKDHPHACGDKQMPFPMLVRRSGSSPRVWGQDRKHHLHPSNRRIIPTRVGTSHHDRPALFPPRDHPHACGDKTLKQTLRLSATGSSPRVWGQVQNILQTLSLLWIIPTRVGTSILSDKSTVYPQDHPHACGDKHQAPLPPNAPSGSSPRVWGQELVFTSTAKATRIIPTRVGTSMLCLAELVKT